MIIVTGTKRSGTSLWMQILQGAGFEVLGSKYPLGWETSIRDANPKGFYESILRRGVYYATNPHPKTGAYISPAASRAHAVKVFAQGLVRSDVAFLNRVIITVRPWREYVRSIERLYELEDRHLATLPRRDDHDPVEAARRRRPQLPPEVEWWWDNYLILRDISVRRYPYHFVAFNAMTDRPFEAVSEALQFLGQGDLPGAIAQIQPSLRTQRQPKVETEHLTPGEILLADTFVEHIESRAPLPNSLLADINSTHRALKERFKPKRARAAQG